MKFGRLDGRVIFHRDGLAARDRKVSRTSAKVTGGGSHQNS